MPAKSSTLRNGPRHQIVSRQLWLTFKDTTGIDIPYMQFVEVIQDSNELIGTKICDNLSGFKMPEQLGYITVTRYKPKKSLRQIDWDATKKNNVIVYHTNMHSYGYKPRVIWLTSRLARCKNVDVYKMVPDRKIMRGTVSRMKAGKTYNDQGYEQFKTRKIRVNLNKLLK